MRRWRVVATLVAALSVACLPPVLADPPAYDFAIVSVQQPPASMHPGLVTTLTVALRNEGTATWFADGAGMPVVRLGTTAPRDRISVFASQDATWLWSDGRRIRMTTPSVEPGGIGVFAFTFRAPELGSYPATFNEHFLPLVEGGPWMETRPDIVLTTTVRPASGAAPPIPRAPEVPEPSPLPTISPEPPPSPTVSPSPLPEPTIPTVPPLPQPPPGYDWEPVLVSPLPATMHPGEKIVVAVVLRNTGGERWLADNFAANPMRLAAVNATGVQPRERASVFGRDDATWIWSGGRRVRMTTPFVEPGGFGIFSFTFTAPALPSYPQTFVERFAPVVEDVALLDDSLVTMSTTVRPLASALPPIPEVPGTDPVPLPTVSLPAVPPSLPTPSELPTPSSLPTPSELPTPSQTPSASPLPTITPPPLPGASCPTTVAPQYQDLWPPAVALLHEADGTMLAGKVGTPSAAAFGLGKLFVADAANDRIARTDAAGFAVDYFGSSGSGLGQMRWPGGLAVSDSGIVFVADTGNNRIQQWGFGGVYLGAFGSLGSAPGQFSSPRGISSVPNGPFAGMLAVADTGNDRIQIVTRTGAPVAVIGSSGTEPGMLSSPASVSVWGDGIYVADTGNNRIQRFSAAGAPTGGWGGEGEDAGCTPLPTGILANEYGVFVAENGANRVEQFTRWGLHLGSIGGVSSPSAIAMDAAAKLYVPEAALNRVTRMSPLVSAAPPPVCRDPDPIDCVR